MDIRFSNIIPTPLAEQSLNGDIWGKELNFSFGEHYHILAPSGKGKSTFAHVFYGLRKDYSGNLFWNEKDFLAYSIDEIQAVRSSTFGIVFQDLRLFLEQTPLDNIAIHQSDLSEGLISPEEIIAFAKRMGIEDLLNKKCALLSYGQRQRVAILRVLSRPFKWLILDEPFSHLDKGNEQAAGELIMEIVQRNNASLVITGLNDIGELMGGAGKLLRL